MGLDGDTPRTGGAGHGAVEMGPVPSRLTPALIDEWTRSGWWPDRTFGRVLDEQEARRPGQTAVVDDRTRLT